jgi:hypothetical protein
MAPVKLFEVLERRPKRRVEVTAAWYRASKTRDASQFCRSDRFTREIAVNS